MEDTSGQLYGTGGDMVGVRRLVSTGGKVGQRRFGQVGSRRLR